MRWLFAQPLAPAVLVVQVEQVGDESPGIRSAYCQLMGRQVAVVKMAVQRAGSAQFIVEGALGLMSVRDGR